MNSSDMPLAGLRIIESSLLGRGSDHHVSCRPRRDGDQGRIARGRLHPRDDLAHHRGRLADALSPEPRQEEHHARPEDRGRQGALSRTGARCRRGDRGDAPRRAGEAGARFRRAAPGESRDRVLHGLRIRHDRSRTRTCPRHGIAYDTWSGAVTPACDDEGFCYIPEHVSIGINAAPLYGGLAVLAGVIARTRQRKRLHDGARRRAMRRPFFDWYRCESYLAYARPEDVVTGNKADGYARRPVATAGMNEGVRYQIYEIERRTRAVHGLGAGVLEELLRRRRTAWTCSSSGPARATPITRAATASCRPNCATIFRSRSSREWIEFSARREHADRTGEHAAEHRRGSAVPGALRAVAARTHGADMMSFPCTSRARNCCPPGRAPAVGEHTEAVLREVLGCDEARLAAIRQSGALGGRREAVVSVRRCPLVIPIWPFAARRRDRARARAG